MRAVFDISGPAWATWTENPRVAHALRIHPVHPIPGLIRNAVVCRRWSVPVIVSPGEMDHHEKNIRRDSAEIRILAGRHRSRPAILGASQVAADAVG